MVSRAFYRRNILLPVNFDWKNSSYFSGLFIQNFAHKGGKLSIRFFIYIICLCIIISVSDTDRRLFSLALYGRNIKHNYYRSKLSTLKVTICFSLLWMKWYINKANKKGEILYSNLRVEDFSCCIASVQNRFHLRFHHFEHIILFIHSFMVCLSFASGLNWATILIFAFINGSLNKMNFTI